MPIIGHVYQWDKVKSKKNKKESGPKSKTNGQQPGNSQRGHQRNNDRSDRGERNERNDRGRPRSGKSRARSEEKEEETIWI